MTEDAQTARDRLQEVAGAEDPQAQSEAAVLAFQQEGRPLDHSRPPAQDPRETGIFGPRTPVSRGERVVADCVKDGRQTVQDIFEVIVGPWLGLTARLPVAERSTAGKAALRGRLRFRACTVCGCLYPCDARTQQYTQAKGGEFFNPAKLSPQRRARAARAMGPHLLGTASVWAALLGVAAFFAAPLVWGPLGILLGIVSYRGRQKLGAAAAGLAALGTAVGLVLHHHAPFGY